MHFFFFYFSDFTSILCFVPSRFSFSFSVSCFCLFIPPFHYQFQYFYLFIFILSFFSSFLSFPFFPFFLLFKAIIILPLFTCFIYCSLSFLNFYLLIRHHFSPYLVLLSLLLFFHFMTS